MIRELLTTSTRIFYVQRGEVTAQAPRFAIHGIAGWVSLRKASSRGMASAFSRGRGNRADRVPAGIDLAMAGTLGMADRVEVSDVISDWMLVCVWRKSGPYHAATADSASPRSTTDA